MNRLILALESYWNRDDTSNDFAIDAPPYNEGMLLSLAESAAEKQEYARMHCILDGINQVFGTNY